MLMKIYYINFSLIFHFPLIFLSSFFMFSIPLLWNIRPCYILCYFPYWPNWHFCLLYKLNQCQGRRTISDLSRKQDCWYYIIHLIWTKPSVTFWGWVIYLELNIRKISQIFHLKVIQIILNPALEYHFFFYAEIINICVIFSEKLHCPLDILVHTKHDVANNTSIIICHLSFARPLRGGGIRTSDFYHAGRS